MEFKYEMVSWRQRVNVLRFSSEIKWKHMRQVFDKSRIFPTHKIA